MVPLYCIILLAGSLLTVNAYPDLNALRARSGQQPAKRGDPSIKAINPFDHTWIEAFASLGDSYAVGLGAGHYIKAAKGLNLNTDCYQYSYGYPNLLNSNDMIGINPNRVFQYLGCSGALVPDITNKQVPKMSNSQLVTISAGGNDANFVTILNYCVYQWATWWPWSCDGQLAEAKTIIDKQEYTDNLNSLIQAISKKLQGSTSRMYWVAYTRPWDTTSDECDKVTWAFTRKIGFRQFLTQARRTTINDLVDNVNSKIKSVCDAAKQCVYVDPNPSIDKLTGHFCEPGVEENYHWPDGGVSANREQTWPYEWGTDKDNDIEAEKKVDQPQKRNDIPGNVDNSTFEGAIANWINLGVEKNEIDPTILATFHGANYTAQGSALPASYGRVFHLNKFATGALAMRILNAMDAEQAKMMNEPAVTTTITYCSTAAVATATSAASTCVGNQIQGSCVQGSEPSATPNSGPLGAVCNKVDAPNNDLVRINADQASQAAADYCANLISAGVVLDSTAEPSRPGIQPGAAENGGELALTVMFDVDSCEPNTAAKDQKIDFNSLGQQGCEMALFTLINAACSQDSTWSNYNKDHTLEGGTVAVSCGLWALTGQPAT